jgi:uncharacterized protein (TIGR02996 family)
MTPNPFLAAILSDPADDTPRLVYADWLDETAEMVPCPQCSQYADDPENPWKCVGYVPARDPASDRHEGGWTNCKKCNAVFGSAGTVSDGRRERAEFIRVQCELARIGNSRPHCTHDKADLPLCRT